MNQVEQRIYPQALAWLAEGRACWRDGRVWFDNRPLEAPIHVDCD
jgi:folate-dependent phosphoribosylglycinamide formyltransferase PurN